MAFEEVTVRVNRDLIHLAIVLCLLTAGLLAAYLLTHPADATAGFAVQWESPGGSTDPALLIDRASTGARSIPNNVSVPLRIAPTYTQHAGTEPPQPILIGPTETRVGSGFKQLAEVEHLVRVRHTGTQIAAIRETPTGIVYLGAHGDQVLSEEAFYARLDAATTAQVRRYLAERSAPRARD